MNDTNLNILRDAFPIGPWGTTIQIDQAEGGAWLDLIGGGDHFVILLSEVKALRDYLDALIAANPTYEGTSL